MLPLVFFSSVMADRFNYYLMPISFMVQSRAYLIFPRKFAMLIFLAPLIVSGLLFFAWSQFSQLFQGCYIPYQSWLDETVIPR